MTAVLLDGNVLVALTVSEHVHHEAASTWFAAQHPEFATTPITQGTLLRFLLRSGVDAVTATELLAATTDHPQHQFWPDDLPYDASMVRGVVGHRQVTDAYLAALARARRGVLATFDRGLAALHADVAVPIGSN